MKAYNEINPESGSTYMYNKYMNKFNLNTQEVDEILNVIAFIESGDRNIEQHGVGHGKGYFQLESKTASGAFQTGLQRYVNINGVEPKWISEARKHDDARKLSRSQQAEITLASLFHDTNEGGSDKRLIDIKNREPNAIRELWINNWWKDTKNKKINGRYETDEEKKIRIDKKREWFDNRLIEYNKQKSGADKIFERELFE